ncbi:hypothetical protein EST38_g8888 [Candolleomyces aberdarensis]|uniref:Uncharacterized protein n=1 Tax=Candolleomyces aberdarensis TaxID=2316362 RepID=A0A4Q2DBD8_9AGAR|nr:hypothetical protein EST38_g8888 [Candolleomyces aberdarensis]
MQGIGTPTEEHKTPGSSSEALYLSTNVGAPEGVKMPPEVGACIAESTDIMDIDFTQHIPGTSSPNPDLSSIWDEEELRKTPPNYERDFDPVAEFYRRSPPPSPTPSYVKVFGVYSCTCAGCVAQAKANPYYPPSVREEKLKLYREWQEKQRRKAREQQRKNQLATIKDQDLRRNRAILVVARALNLSELEAEQWRAQSHEKWYSQMMKEFDDRYPLRTD